MFLLFEALFMIYFILLAKIFCLLKFLLDSIFLRMFRAISLIIAFILLFVIFFHLYVFTFPRRLIADMIILLVFLNILLLFYMYYIVILFSLYRLLRSISSYSFSLTFIAKESTLLIYSTLPFAYSLLVLNVSWNEEFFLLERLYLNWMIEDISLGRCTILWFGIDLLCYL